MSDIDTTSVAKDAAAAKNKSSGPPSGRTVPLIHPTLVHPSPELATLIPEDVARRLNVLPVLVSGGSTLWLAMEDPSNKAAIEECSTLTKLRARAMIASGDEIRASFHRWYGGAKPKPSLPPPRRKTSVLELDAVDLDEETEAPPLPPPVPRAPPLPGSTPKPPVVGSTPKPPVVAAPVAPAPVVAAPVLPEKPAVVVVVQALPALLQACRDAFKNEAVIVQEADLVDAAMITRELSPFAIVLPEDVFEFDPFAFETLALSVRALLISAHESQPHQLRAVLMTAHRRLYG